MNSYKPITLRIQGLSHVPSFKNTKMIARGRLITNPKKRKWMDKATDSMLSQLRYWCQTGAGVTLTAHSQPLWTASLMPLDDCMDWIPKITVTARRVAKGQEGATITIERIP